MGSSATGMATDKELIKEAGQELWNTVKKLRPGLPKEARSQLVLKALLTIGDLPINCKRRWCLDKLLIRSPMRRLRKKAPKADHRSIIRRHQLMPVAVSGLGPRGEGTTSPTGDTPAPAPWGIPGDFSLSAL